MSNEHNNATAVPQGEPIACLVRHRRLQTPKRLAHDGQDHFSEWSDWRPETLKYGEAVTDPLRNSGPECLFEMQPLYATPAPAPAVPQEVGLTDEEITQVCSGIYLSDHPQGSASYDVALARAIIAAHEAKQATAAPAPAQEPVALDLWCETCGGSGVVHEDYQIGTPGVGGDRDCPDCGGHGYIRTSGYRIANKPAQDVVLTDEGRQQVFIAAERRMVREPNLSWRDAIVDEVIAALRAKGGKHV